MDRGLLNGVCIKEKTKNVIPFKSYSPKKVVPELVEFLEGLQELKEGRNLFRCWSGSGLAKWHRLESDATSIQQKESGHLNVWLLL